MAKEDSNKSFGNAQDTLVLGFSCGNVHNLSDEIETEIRRVKSQHPDKTVRVAGFSTSINSFHDICAILILTVD